MAASVRQRAFGVPASSHLCCGCERALLCPLLQITKQPHSGTEATRPRFAIVHYYLRWESSYKRQRNNWQTRKTGNQCVVYGWPTCVRSFIYLIQRIRTKWSLVDCYCGESDGGTIWSRSVPVLKLQRALNQGSVISLGTPFPKDQWCWREPSWITYII